LTTIPPLPTTPSDFAPGERLTEEKMKALGVLENEFLTEEERKLVAWVLVVNKRVLAFDESQKRRFSSEIFPPLLLPVLLHIPR
jgi:hypothetical protein